MKKYIISAAILLCSALLSFTHFYSIGYLAVIAVSVQFFHGMSVFRTLAQRFVLALLTLLAVIPIVGLVCWFTGIQNHPILNILGFVIVILLLRERPVETKARVPIIDRLDLVAVTIALLPVVVILLSIIASPNKSATLFQLASEGWDNGAHILMLEDTSSENGYMYGYADDLKHKIIRGSNAYPQAWHLATSNFVNGFGGNKFIPQQPIQTILAYMIASLSWMVLAGYLFTLIALRLYESVTNKIARSLPVMVAISATSIIVQSIVLYGSLASGFTNYIGSIVYILLLIAVIPDIIHSHKIRSFILLLLFSAISVVTWFLILPAVLGMAVFLICTWKGSVRRSLKAYFTNVRLVLLTVFCSFAVLLQLYIFAKYSSAGAGDQLNAGVQIHAFLPTVGVFSVSQVLLAGLILVCVTFYLRLNNAKFKSHLALSVLPWLMLVAFIYFYQNITVGYNSYYLAKAFGLCLIVAGIFASVYAAIWLTNLSSIKGGLYKSCLFLVIIFIVLLGTGQSMYGLNKLFQQNARTTYGTATKIVSLLRQNDNRTNNIVVLRNNVYFDGSLEDFHGKLEYQVLHKSFNCAYRITRGDGSALKDTIERLAICADKLKGVGQKITVITSDTTYDLVKDLDRDNVFIQNVSK